MNNKKKLFETFVDENLHLSILTYINLSVDFLENSQQEYNVNI